MKNIALILFVLVYSFDLELKSSSSYNDYSVETVCKVVKNGKTHTYMYSLKNTSKSKVKVSWDTVSKAMNLGDDVELIFDLDPGENLVFVLESESPPQEVVGTSKIFYLTNDKKFVKDNTNVPKITMPNKAFYQGLSIKGHSDILPENYVVER